MGKRKVVIRVDGNSNIGLGHIYRGIALAEMLKDEFSVSFYTRHDSTTVPIIDAGFKFENIPEEIELSEEPQYFNSIFSKETIIVLDGYDFKEDYQKQIKTHNFKLVYIDDLTEGTQQADLVINHSPNTKKSDYKTESNTTLALGFDYALLRQSFLRTSMSPHFIRRNYKKVFVSFGGSDFNDLTLKSVKALESISAINEIIVVVGSAYKGGVESYLGRKVQNKVSVFRNLPEKDILKVMEDCDFAISPASTTLMELLAVGLPTVSGYFVENQYRFYKYLQQNNIVYGIGNFNTLCNIEFVQSLNNFMKNFQISKGKLIDGKQTYRIIDKFKSL